jgi:diaminopimelate epimerase
METKTKKLIHFIKMHGLGNDYIFVDTTVNDLPDPQAAAIAWSRPHFGIGSDGVVLIGRSSTPEADFTMRFFNADGSEGLMCGNASRCIGKYVYERGLTTSTQVRLLTGSGVKLLQLAVNDQSKVEQVTVDMLEPQFDVPDQFLPDGEPLPPGVFVSMGSAHYVIFVDDIDAVKLEVEGPILEHHSRFPQRCNIEFAQITPQGIRMRVWERGSGITMACGSGASATAVAAALTGRASRDSLVIMDGGTLRIEWRANNHVYMSGPATIVFEGDIPLP